MIIGQQGVEEKRERERKDVAVLLGEFVLASRSISGFPRSGPGLKICSHEFVSGDYAKH